MTMEPPKSGNTYIIDAERGAEIARLLNQDRLITRSMGALFPERCDPSTMHDVLDIACGPGGWVLDVAFAYPKIQAVGIDIGPTMVEYARALAQVQQLENASFITMDALRPLDFPENAFDLVNARFLSGFMPNTAWSVLMQECVRVARPGGIIRLTESECGITNSYGHEKLYGMCTRALQLAGRSFSPDGRQIGITPMLGLFLSDVGCQNIQQVAYAIDCSAGTEAQQSFYENFMSTFNLLRPFLLSMEVTTPQEYDRLYQQALVEMHSDDFRGLGFMLSVCGEKPSHGTIAIHPHA